MESSFTRLSGILILGGLLSGCGNTSNPTLQSTPLSATDSAFITGATQSSNAEIGAAKIALTKSQNADVIAFANEMVTQHTQEKVALEPIATVAGVVPPSNVNPTQAATAATLQATAEPAFDALYINSEIQGHTLNLNNNYKVEIASGTNPSVVGYAKQYEPQIEMHLQMAQTIKARYGY
jgi:putative membrane protein